MTASYPLYHPDDHHDACGVGFIADRNGRSTHRVVRMGVTCLHGLDHRGAKAADGTGDGAGVMTRVPYRILERVLIGKGIDPPPRNRLGLVMAFLPPDDRDNARKIVDDSLMAEGLDLVSWRKVPVGANVLGEAARASMPAIEQAIVTAPYDDVPRFERSLFLARKTAERAARSAGLNGFALPSASARTVVYKGLFTASTVEAFYWDLIDPMFESDFVIFHQRYSTNTQPSWEAAQPFNVLAHNGEINTVAANRSWMAARGADIGETVWGDRSADLRPLVSQAGSDSASLDDAFEVLLRSGRSLTHVKEMLIPAAWENVTDLDPALESFYEYHAFLSEPWDGPAAIAASDGTQVIAGLDRNGLRPARWTETPEFVLVASEAGLIPSFEIDAVATGQLGPGEVIAVDLATGVVRHSDEVKAALAARKPYGDWISTKTLYVRHAFDDLQDDRYDPDALARVFGYTAEERRLLLQQMAEGSEPILSMGHDTGLAVLADTPQRLPRFFHQAFAQVTNPPMDPIREWLVMSLRTYLGARGSIVDETPEQAHLVELSSPVLSDAEVQHLTSADGFTAVWLQTTFAAADGEQALEPAIESLCDAAEEAVAGGANLIVLSDREVDAEMAPIPIILATGAVHHRLIDRGLRLRASIVVVSGEPR
ncbi:MAG: glutamate synthase subunit alpha, partial [Acidimicrobiia bacterium]|nr:glutamate synthase subunit alpha [Acidimicrobiia bacterium]